MGDHVHGGRQATIRAILDRGKTELLLDVPFAWLTISHARDTRKQTQWRAFVEMIRLEALELGVLLAALRSFLLQPIAAASAVTHFPQLWPASRPYLSGGLKPFSVKGQIARGRPYPRLSLHHTTRGGFFGGIPGV